MFLGRYDEFCRRSGKSQCLARPGAQFLIGLRLVNVGKKISNELGRCPLLSVGREGGVEVFHAVLCSIMQSCLVLCSSMQ